MNLLNQVYTPSMGKKAKTVIAKTGKGKKTASKADTPLDMEILQLEEEERLLDLDIKRAELAKKKKILQDLVQQSADCGPDTGASSDIVNDEAVNEAGKKNISIASSITTQSLAEDKKLETALATMNNLDFLDPQTTGGDTKEMPGKSMGLNIPSFISIAKSGAGAKDGKLKRVDDVTIPQWISANARILLKLLDTNMSTEQLKGYIRYTAKIGDYLQVSTPQSVMLLDDVHRSQVEEEGRDWNNIDSDKVYFHLKQMEGSAIGEAGFQSKSWQKKTSEGQVICKRYNRNSCNLTFCKFAHVCMWCCGSHPQHQHHQASSQGAQLNQNAPPYQPRYDQSSTQPLSQRFRHSQ